MSSWCHLWSPGPGSLPWDICITAATSVGCVSYYTCCTCLVSRSLLPQTTLPNFPLSRKRRIMFFHRRAPVCSGATIFCDYRGTFHPHNHSGKMFPIVDMHNTFKKHLCQGSHIMLTFLYYLTCLSLKISAVPNDSELFDRRLKFVMPGFLETRYYHTTTHSTKCTFVIWNLNADQLIFSLFNRLLFWHIFPPPYHLGKKQESQSHEKTVFQCKLFKLTLMNGGLPSNCWSRYTVLDKITQAPLLSLADPKGGSNRAACSIPKRWCLLSLGHTTGHPSSLNWCRMTVSRMGEACASTEWVLEQVHLFLQRWRSLAGGVQAAPSAKIKEWGMGKETGLCLAYHGTGMKITETGNVAYWAWACCLGWE